MSLKNLELLDNEQMESLFDKFERDGYEIKRTEEICTSLKMSMQTMKYNLANCLQNTLLQNEKNLFENHTIQSTQLIDKLNLEIAQSILSQLSTMIDSNQKRVLKQIFKLCHFKKTYNDEIYDEITQKQRLGLHVKFLGYIQNMQKLEEKQKQENLLPQKSEDIFAPHIFPLINQSFCSSQGDIKEMQSELREMGQTWDFKDLLSKVENVQLIGLYRAQKVGSQLGWFRGLSWKNFLHKYQNGWKNWDFDIKKIALRSGLFGDATTEENKELCKCLKKKNTKGQGTKQIQGTFVNILKQQMRKILFLEQNNKNQIP